MSESVMDRAELRPAITVAVCTHNRAHLLARTLESLQRQDLRTVSCEVLVVDDGSTDNTEEVVRSAAIGSAIAVRYVWQANAGVGPARNRAVGEARSPWIAFIDDDEVASESWLAELWSVAQGTAADCVGGPCLLKIVGTAEYEPVGTVRMLLGENPAMQKHGRKLSFFDRFRFWATRSALPGGGNVLVRVDLIQKMGGFCRTRIGEDMELFRRAAQRGANFAVAPRACIHHMIPAERLEHANLYSLAQRGGETQAKIDAGPGPSTRVCLLVASRIVHAAFITTPMLLLAFVRASKAEIVSRQCSLRFASAYLAEIMTGWGERG